MLQTPLQMSSETAPLLGRASPRGTRPSKRTSRTTSLEDAWAEPNDKNVGEPADYSSIIFNLHVWSYRLSQQEFTKYERSAQLQQAADTFDPRNLSMLFCSMRAPRSAARHAAMQYSSTYPTTGRDAEAGTAVSAAAAAAADAPECAQARRYIGFRATHQSYTPTQQGFAGEAAKTLKPRTPLGMPVLPVNHPLMAAWSMLMVLVDMVYTAVALPLMFAFQLLRPENGVFWLSVAVGFLYFLDMLLVLRRGVVIRYLDKHIYIDNARDVAVLYLRHGPFLADLAVALSGPLQLLALLPGVRAAGPLEGRGLMMVNVFVMLRGIRLVKLLLLSRELFFGKMGFRHMGPALHRWYSLSLVYVLAVLINWLACIMLSIAHAEGLENSWLADVKGRDLTQAPHTTKYIAAFYWMLISTLTVGYGDISAATSLEQAAVVGAVLTGVLFIGYAIKSITDVMVEAALQDEHTQRLSTLRRRAAELKMWASWQDLPEDLVDPMFRYFMGPWLTKKVVTGHWGNVLEDLPAQLRGQVLDHLLVDKHKELSPLGSRLLIGIPEQACWHVLALLQPVVLAPGQQLCWEGLPAEHIWLLQEGAVVALNGVVPNLDTMVDMPGMLVAFDTAAWLARQRTQQQQQQQQWQRQRRQQGGQQTPTGLACSDAPTADVPLGQHCSTCEQDAALLTAAAAATPAHVQQPAPQSFESTSEATPRYHSISTAAPSNGTRRSISGQDNTQPYPSSTPSPGLGPGSPAPDNPGSTVVQNVAAEPLCYSVSYQAVSSCFFWALPLHQLGLAFSGLPQLLENFEAELLGSQL